MNYKIYYNNYLEGFQSIHSLTGSLRIFLSNPRRSIQRDENHLQLDFFLKSCISHRLEFKTPIKDGVA
ncbi:hypothetical protein F0562_032052 [Nyssa sinensis]|uniref:Uncharacterized protein n=1 Tax=Nyssa sinensis TaxID=561372 RepID=A0A5J5ATT3_9ASTE|nr:hypothetical protein F0562_032052 [Nyssa sinensis]